MSKASKISTTSFTTCFGYQELGDYGLLSAMLNQETQKVAFFDVERRFQIGWSSKSIVEFLLHPIQHI